MSSLRCTQCGKPPRSDGIVVGKAGVVFCRLLSEAKELRDEILRFAQNDIGMSLSEIIMLYLQGELVI